MKHFVNEVSSPCVYANGISLQFSDASEVILLLPSSKLIQVDILIRSEQPKQLWQRVLTTMEIDIGITQILFLLPKQLFDNPRTFPLELEQLDAADKEYYSSFIEIEEGILGDSTQPQHYPWSFIDNLDVATPYRLRSPLNILELKLPGLGLFLECLLQLT